MVEWKGVACAGSSWARKGFVLGVCLSCWRRFAVALPSLGGPSLSKPGRSTPALAWTVGLVRPGEGNYGGVWSLTHVLQKRAASEEVV